MTDSIHDDPEYCDYVERLCDVVEDLTWNNEPEEAREAIVKARGYLQMLSNRLDLYDEADIEVWEDAQ